MRYHTPKAQEARRMASEGAPLARISRVLDKPISWVRSVLSETGFLFRQEVYEAKKKALWESACYIHLSGSPVRGFVALSAKQYGVCEATIRVWLDEWVVDVNRVARGKK